MNSNLITASRQILTRKWWDKRRHSFRLMISTLVIEEASRGDVFQAELRKTLLEEGDLIEPDKTATELAHFLLGKGIIPPKAVADALHIAVSATAKFDFLLTWNCKHIANGSIQKKLRMLCREKGYELPTICTPEELMEDNHER